VTVLLPEISIKAVATIENNKPFSDARFSADGLSVVTKCKTGYERWDANTGERLGAPEPHDPDVNTFAAQAREEIGCVTCLTSAPMGQFRHIAERRVSGSS
jgi:hypothetical protein